MGGETYVDVSYRGLELGRRHRLCEIGPTTGYLEHPTPMPVGTRLELAADGGVALAVEVVRIHEQHAGVERTPGMRVRATALDERAASLWRSLVGVDDPAPPVVAPDPPAAAAASDAREAGGSADESGAPTEQMAAVDIETILAGREQGDVDVEPEPPPSPDDKPKGRARRGSVKVRKKK